MKVAVVNQQKIKRLNIRELRVSLQRISRILGLSSKKVSLVICDNSFIRDLNRRYFRKNSATDVISFPLADDLDRDDLGEVVVSLEEAVNRCREYGHAWKTEFLLYVIHGILHLLGYTDGTVSQRRKMEEKQRNVLLRIRKDYHG